MYLIWSGSEDTKTKTHIICLEQVMYMVMCEHATYENVRLFICLLFVFRVVHQKRSYRNSTKLQIYITEAEKRRQKPVSTKCSAGAKW